jgi:hypothetical protein
MKRCFLRPCAAFACGLLLLETGCEKAPAPRGTAGGAKQSAGEKAAWPEGNSRPASPAESGAPGIQPGSNAFAQAATPSLLAPLPNSPAETVTALREKAEHPLPGQEGPAELKRLFDHLREQGAAALPAIDAYLQRNEDVLLPGGPHTAPGDYASLRAGLIDLLAGIGGPDAADVASRALQQTSDPLEVATLTRALEQIAPRQYADMESAAVRDLLGQVKAGQLGAPAADPLFEAAQAIGGADLVPALRDAVSAAGYPATLALAALKDGAGIPALTALARDPALAGSNDDNIALRPLAQAAYQYPAAASALVDLAGHNAIPEKDWEGIAAALSGTYMQYGNSLFGATTPSVDWSDAAIGRRLDLLQNLTAATTSGTGRKTLQNAIAALSARRAP